MGGMASVVSSSRYAAPGPCKHRSVPLPLVPRATVVVFLVFSLWLVPGVPCFCLTLPCILAVICSHFLVFVDT